MLFVLFFVWLFETFYFCVWLLESFFEVSRAARTEKIWVCVAAKKKILLKTEQKKLKMERSRLRPILLLMCLFLSLVFRQQLAGFGQK